MVAALRIFKCGAKSMPARTAVECLGEGAGGRREHVLHGYGALINPV